MSRRSFILSSLTPLFPKLAIYIFFRVRFPDGWLLQGTFAVQEQLSAVSEFVSEHLETPLPHVLADSVTGQKFGLGEEGTLADLGFESTQTLFKGTDGVSNCQVWCLQLC